MPEAITNGPDLSVLDPTWRVDPATVKPVGEGVWFAWRRSERAWTSPGLPMFDVRNGIYWLHDGSKAVSLASGTTLHFHGGMDWETYVFRPVEAQDLDVCCHSTEDDATKCALTFFATGRWCHTWDDES